MSANTTSSSKTSSHTSLTSVPSGTSSSSRHSPRHHILRVRHHLPHAGARKGFGRPEWGRPIDFPLTSIAAAIGASNVVKFSWLICNYGGIAFLVPYFFFFFVCSYPLLYLEIVIGQSIKEGIMSVWKIVPIFKGIGYSIETIVITILFFDLTPATWTLIYLGNSFGDTLPWTRCDNPWNTKQCKAYSRNNSANGSISSTTTELPRRYGMQVTNVTNNASEDEVGPGSEFLRGRILRIYKSPFSDPHEYSTPEEKAYFINNGSASYGFTSELGLGSPVIELTLCLIVFFIFLYIFLVKGITWTGFLSRVTVPVPYLILIFLLIRGMFVEGALAGVQELCWPKWEFLFRPEVWAFGAAQAFFSLDSGFGMHMTLAGYNKVNRNVWKDSLIIAWGNTCFSLIAAVTMCEYIGHAAWVRGISASEYISNIRPLDYAFVVIPDATSTISGGAFGNFMFFAMFLIITLDSSLITLSVLIASITDDIRFLFPNPKQAASVILFAVVAVAFTANSFTLTRGGLWVFEFLDDYAIAIPICITILVQTIAISWIWGFKEINEVFKETTGAKPGVYMQLCWKYLSPISLSVVLFFLVNDSSPSIVEGQEMPISFHVFGTVLKFLACLCIPCYVIYKLVFDRRKEITFFQNFLLLFWPKDEHQMLIETTVRNRLTMSHLLYTGMCECFGSKDAPINPERNRKASPELDKNPERNIRAIPKLDKNPERNIRANPELTKNPERNRKASPELDKNPERNRRASPELDKNPERNRRASPELDKNPSVSIKYSEASVSDTSRFVSVTSATDTNTTPVMKRVAQEFRIEVEELESISPATSTASTASKKKSKKKKAGSKKKKLKKVRKDDSAASVTSAASSKSRKSWQF